MKESKLRYIFKYVAFLTFRTYQLSDNLELYNFETDETVYFDSYYECLNYYLDRKTTVSDELDALNIDFVYRGGRGSSSSKKMSGGFTSAEGDGKDETRSLHPAEFNRQGRFTSPEKAFKMFEERYADKDREYGMSVDSMGYVHSHKIGNKHSISINASGREHIVIHNHPGGGHFSHADLKNTAMDKKAKGVIATGVKDGKLHRYTFEKTHKFNASSFNKAISKAKWPKHLSYDEGASWWLKKNQKKYGYKYSESHESRNKKNKGQLSFF